ncbi:MAG: phosphatidylglycerophosphatase A [Pseudomonadota bacterium]
MQKHLRERVSLLNIQHFAALGFGSGLAPFMPGTFGTLAGLPLVWLMSYTPGYVYIGIVVLAFLTGIKVCQTTSDALKTHDHGGIVWDEIVGIMITFVFVPFNWMTIILGFLLFRLFDIVKPWPIGMLDKRIKGGLGIMIDDVIAGVFACLILNLTYPLLLPYLKHFT